MGKWTDSDDFWIVRPDENGIQSVSVSDAQRTVNKLRARVEELEREREVAIESREYWKDAHAEIVKLALRLSA